MRYFKYKNTNKNDNHTLKEEYKHLIINESIVRKEKLWRKLSTIISSIVYIFCIVLGVYLIELTPQPNGLVAGIFVAIGKVMIFLIWLIVSVLLTFGFTHPLWEDVESLHLPTMKKEILSKACSHLRDYYELQEPYIVTKCFDATDERFKKHDVCIFIVRDELRITTDLIRGFLHEERDLGCYAFKLNEVTLSKQLWKNGLIVELREDNTVFLLGYRAKGFIELWTMRIRKDSDGINKERYKEVFGKEFENQ